MSCALPAAPGVEGGEVAVGRAVAGVPLGRVHFGLGDGDAERGLLAADGQVAGQQGGQAAQVLHAPRPSSGRRSGSRGRRRRPADARRRNRRQAWRSKTWGATGAGAVRATGGGGSAAGAASGGRKPPDRENNTGAARPPRKRARRRHTERNSRMGSILRGRGSGEGDGGPSARGRRHSRPAAPVICIGRGEMESARSPANCAAGGGAARRWCRLGKIGEGGCQSERRPAVIIPEQSAAPTWTDPT